MAELVKDQILEDGMAKDEMVEDEVAWYGKGITKLTIRGIFAVNFKWKIVKSNCFVRNLNHLLKNKN